MSNAPALVAGSDGLAGHLRLYVEKSIRIDLRPVGMVTDGEPSLNLTATPPYAYSSSTASVSIVGTIEPPMVFADPGFDLKWTLTGIVLEYFRTAAGDVMGFYIHRSPRSGHAAAGAAIVSMTEATEFATTVAWTTLLYTTGLPIVLDFSLYTYTYTWITDPVTASTDSRIGMSCYGTATVQAVL